MRLSALIDALPEALGPRTWVNRDSNSDPVIRGMGYDSRQVSPGDLFVALRGAVSDGHDFIERALTLGAAAVLVEEAPAPEQLGSAVSIVVEDTRRAMPIRSGERICRPSLFGGPSPSVLHLNALPKCVSFPIRALCPV